jgi:hypothetical protein
MFCAANSVACDLFIALDEKEKSVAFKKCLNDDLVLKA